jgi:hypothetical protein
MRQLIVFAICFLSVTSLLAQDVDFGAFSDAPPAMAAPAARGAAPTRGAVTAPPPPDRLVRLRDILLKAEAPLTREQETALNAIITAEIPVMRKTIQTKGQEMMAARPPVTPATPPATAAAAPPPPPPPAPGAPPNAALAAALAARGASPSSRVPADILDALEVEMRQMNDALFTKIATAPALDAKQQSILRKSSRDQIKSRGGYEALRISMEDANAPFTEDQIPRVQAVFEDQKKARAEMAKESGGTPDPAKLKQLERDSLTKVVGILTAAQRTALLTMLRSTQ